MTNTPGFIRSDSGELWEPLLPEGQQEEEEQVLEKDVVFPKWVTFWRSSSLPPARLNHNVFWMLVLDVVYGISDSLWFGTVFAAYLKRLGHERNGPVGDIEAINGLAVLVSALPVGYLADKLGRSRVVAAGGVLFMITAAVNFGLVWWIGDDVDAFADDHNHRDRIAFVLLGTVMAMWGIGGGVVSGPAQALYADSTPAGERSVYYMYVFTAYVLSSCMGPLLSIVLFQTLGDVWDLYHLRAVIFVGLGMEMINAFIMLLFDDRKALDEDQPATIDESPNDNEDNDNDDDDKADEEAETTGLVNGGEATTTDQEADDALDTLQQRRKWIPYILFFSSLTIAFGSGMTVKFFPLFFKDDVGLSPTQVQIIYVIVPITMVIMGALVTRVAAVIGRVQATILTYVLGVSCLFSMVLFKTYLDSHPMVLVPVYVIRTALMNSSYPLQESILMDFVPKNQRARWKSLESISQFGWCGSAALGGYLSDRWDYSSTFFITAVIQSASIGFFGFLIPLVPRKESDAAAPAATTRQEEQE